jgi:hypothetical protein
MPRPEPRSPRAAQAEAAPPAESNLRFSWLNGAFLLAGLIAIVGGFALLAGGSTVAAPLVLVLGFAVLIPLGIIL